MTPDPELTAGKEIAGKYRLERLLGEGGMGAVWAARHLLTQKLVALKFLKQADPGTRRRFLREARAASAVGHPNVVSIHDLVELDDSTLFMVMDLLEGETLAARLAREHRLPLAETARILACVCSALGTAHHRGIIHRDLKPENVFLVRAGGDPPAVKVLDFGIAKLTAREGEAAETGALTGTGSMLGTPYYMAPEQVFAERDLDHRVDVWALGVMLFECLAGVRPTEAEGLGQIFKRITATDLPRLAEVAPDVPADVTALVERMLSRDRAERPSDLREVLETLTHHTRVTILPFGAPRAQASWPPGSEPGPDSGAASSETPSLEHADTLLADGSTPPSAGNETGSVTGTAAVSTLQAPPPRRTAPWLFAVVLGAAGAAALAWLSQSSRAEGEPALAGSSPAVEQSARGAPERSLPSEPAAPSTAVEVADAAPPAAARPASSPAPAGAKRPPAAPSASASPPAPSTKPPRTPGGVIDQAPF